MGQGKSGWDRVREGGTGKEWARQGKRGWDKVREGGTG